MTTPRPTTELVTSPTSVPSAPELPDWLPDESTLNRLAGEFFAALPGAGPTGSGLTNSLSAAPALPGTDLPASGGPGNPVPTRAGEVEHAPRVDVPARANSISRVPGDTGADPVAPPTGGAPGGLPAFDPPGVQAADPVAASGISPSRAVPDVSELLSGVLGVHGLGAPVPEGPLVPGVTGLDLAAPGEFTPPAAGLTAPLPGAGAPGVPASDQVVGAGGLPNGPPDVTAGAPFAGGFGPPIAAPESVGAVPFTAPGGIAVPSAPGGEMVPPLQGLSAPLPSAGVPGAPASDQVVSGAGVPGGSPDLTGAAPLGAAAFAGPPTTAPAGAAGIPTTGAAPISGAPFAPVGGLVTPELPSVPGIPGVTGATGQHAVTSDAGGTAAEPPRVDPTAGLSGGVDAVPTPSFPQPPVPVPDPPAPVPTPSSPYYFIAESSPYRGAGDGGLDTLVGAALNPAQVASPSLDPAVGAAGGFPGGYDPAVAGSAAPPAVDARSVPGLSPVFYFVDRPTSTPTSAPGGSSSALGFDPHPPFDVRLVRRDFPILSERVNGKPLVWLDNAATTQKPQAVLDRLAHFYQHENSNIHRAAHELAARATDAYEGARKTVARFIGAGSEKEIVFVRGATEAINLVAKSWGKKNIHRGDEIIVSHLEHHANIVPWQQLIAETGAKLRVIPVDDTGQILLNEYAKLLCEKTKLVSVTQVSNALGTVTPIEQIVDMGHRAGACVMIDGAQSVPHLRVNMQALGADFFVFSGHKIFGPTGIGVLYGRPEVLESMPPWEGGGNMIADVTFEKTVFQHPPNRFEAGTGNIADAVGLGAALEYVNRLGLETLANYEHSLLEYATPRMLAVRGLRMIGTATNKASVLSFVLDGYRTEEVGAALNQEGIAVRSGHHCAQPILRRFGVEATVRPSLAFYNTHEEIDLLVAVLHRLAADRGRH